MSKLAINIALIPPENIIDDIIYLNSRCIGDSENFILSHSDKIPHMTILMGWIEEENIDDLGRLLESYLDKENKGIQVISNNIRTSELSDGRSWQYIEALPHESLQGIYSYVIDELKPLMTYDTQKVGYVENDDVNDITVKWTFQHKSRDSERIFKPHISIGIGGLEEKEYSSSFLVDSIGIYQLGNYCTCRKLLKSIKL